MEKKITTPIIKGIVITLIMVVLGLIIYFTGQMANKALSYVQYIVLIVGVVLSCTSFAKQMNANVTFGNVFAHGFKTSMVSAVLLVIYTILALKVLFPDMLDTIINTARQDMVNQGKLTESQIQSALDMTKKFVIPFAIGGILVMFAVFGAIASLIGAAIAKKQPQDPFASQTHM